MSTDPHAPTPTGPDPDEQTEVQSAAPVDPFAPPADTSFPGPVNPDALVAARTPEAAEATTAPAASPQTRPAADRSTGSVVATDPSWDTAAPLGAPVEGVASTDPGGGTIDPPPSAAEAGPPDAGATPAPAPTPERESAWMKYDARAGAAASESDPVVRTPSASTPPGTLESGTAEKIEQLKALTERPEVMVGLAFVGGAFLSLVLKRFGR